MFNKELRQRNKELRKTIVDLETSINFKNDLIKSQKEEIANLKFNLEAWRLRAKVWEKDRLALNNVISNLMEERNKLVVKTIRKARKIESKKIETTTDQDK